MFVTGNGLAGGLDIVSRDFLVIKKEVEDLQCLFLVIDEVELLNHSVHRCCCQQRWLASFVVEMICLYVAVTSKR